MNSFGESGSPYLTPLFILIFEPILYLLYLYSWHISFSKSLRIYILYLLFLKLPRYYCVIQYRKLFWKLRIKICGILYIFRLLGLGTWVWLCVLNPDLKRRLGLSASGRRYLGIFMRADKAYWAIISNYRLGRLFCTVKLFQIPIRYGTVSSSNILLNIIVIGPSSRALAILIY